ncbi:MAG TPA: hypothetical protein VJJ78_00630 [Candidatus Saccharimonadales bacterium]|nr:hypothetical protein [Candidatus Saccharimonadales bacterium]
MFSRNQSGVAHFLLLVVTVVVVGSIGYFVYSRSKVQNQTITKTSNKAKSFGKHWDKLIDKALEPVECPVTPKAQLSPTHYKGPLIDAHYHIPSLPDGGPSEDYSQETSGKDTNVQPLLAINSSISRIVCTMEREGTRGVFAWFSVFPEIDEQSVELVRRVMEKYSDKFVPFIMPPDSDDKPDGSPTVNAKTLTKMLDYEPGLFKGYGEIGLYARKGGSKELPPDNKRLLDIYPVVRANNLMVFFHLGEGQQASFEKVLRANRDINFLFHGDQLIPYGVDGKQDLSHIEEILTRNPNAYYGVDELYGDDFILRPEVGKQEFLAHFDNYEPLLEEDVATWKGFIERHSNQVMWDTDRGWSSPWSMEIEAGLQLTDYARAFIGRLDPNVQEKYAYKNAERLLSNSVKDN